MWANLTADKLKHLLHLQPVCYTYNPCVTLTTCLLHLQTRCYTYNLFATLKPHYSFHLNLFVTLTTSYATLTTSLFVTLTTSLLHLQPLCLLHLQPVCYTYNFFVTLTTSLLHLQPLCLLHLHPFCARHGCTTVGLPGRGMCPASLRGSLQQPSLRQQWHRPRLQACRQLSAECAGRERGAERGIQEQLRALARPGGLWAHSGLGPHVGHMLRTRAHCGFRGEVWQVLRTWAHCGFRGEVGQVLRTWAHCGFRGEVGHVLRTQEHCGFRGEVGQLLRTQAHCGFRVKWDRCWGHRRAVGLGVKWDRCWGHSLERDNQQKRCCRVKGEWRSMGVEATAWRGTTNRKDAVGLRVNEGRWVLRPQPGEGQPTEKTL